MSRHTQINRADLLACLQAYGEAQLDTFADLLGYTRRETPKPPQPPPSSEPETASYIPNTRKSLPPMTTPKARFCRVVAQRHLEPAEVIRDEPDWYRRAVSLQADDPALRANAAAEPPPPAPPLMPWSRLWPFLKTVLGAQQLTHTLDIPRIVERLARRQVLTDLPRKPRQGWAITCQVIVDYAAPLFPFWSDFQELIERLQPLRSTQGLALFAFPDGDPGGRCWSYAAQDWYEIDGYRLPIPGTPVLVLSDLGCLDRTDGRRRQWRHLGLRLRRAGCRPVALMPCPMRWWDAELARLFYPVCWDRNTRPPQRFAARRVLPVPATPTVTVRDAGAELLLSLLAPAIRVEPALLRAVRYLLPVQDADVGSEAAAWNHQQVHANSLAFYYDHAAIDTYRDRFKRVKNKEPYQELCEKIAMLIAAHHAPLSPVITEEERQIAADLIGSPAPKAELLADFVKTLRTQEGELTHALQAWVQRMARRQHASSMWQNDVMAALWVTGHLPYLRQGERLEFPPELELRRVSWLLTQEREPKRYTLRQRGRTLYLEPDAFPSHTTELDAPGSPLADVRAAAPRVHWRQSEWEPSASQPINQAIPLPESRRLHLYTDYQELIIDRIERPAWADAIGRDAYGLFADVSVAGIQQRLRWIMPGEFIMGSPEDEAERDNDETPHRVILSQGFWLADTTCTQALWRSIMGRNPSHFKGEDRPVENVTWNNVQRFLSRLNAAVPGGGFRLPTEAEWEYACRAGTTAAFWFGNQITPEQVNYDGNYPYAGGRKGLYREETVAVKALPCNGWGLYQMHGNIWEWCQDWYGSYPPGSVTDPVGPAEGGARVLRGGGWFNFGGFARSAFRPRVVPGYRLVSFGFRLARGQAVGG